MKYLLLLTVLMVGCTQTKYVRVEVPVEVKVPVMQKVLPPAELYTYSALPIPMWVAPLSPTASSCLTAEGESQLKAILVQDSEKKKGLQSWIQSSP